MCRQQRGFFQPSATSLPQARKLKDFMKMSIVYLNSHLKCVLNTCALPSPIPKNTQHNHANAPHLHRPTLRKNQTRKHPAFHTRQIRRRQIIRFSSRRNALSTLPICTSRPWRASAALPSTCSCFCGALPSTRKPNICRPKPFDLRSLLVVTFSICVVINQKGDM